MCKSAKIFMGLFFVLSICLQNSSVSTAESKFSIENTDGDKMKIYSEYKYADVTNKTVLNHFGIISRDYDDK